MLKIILFVVSVVTLPILIISGSVSLNKLFGKLFFLSGLLVLLIIHRLLFGTTVLAALYLFSFASIFVFDQIGGIMALLINYSLLIIYFNFGLSSILHHILYFLVIALIGGKLIAKIKTFITKNRRLNLNLANQIKELRVLREITALLQETIELDKILHLILLAVTAGYGLEFNRAILFLVEDNKLTGKTGIGPLNREEGLTKWQGVAKKKLNLDDMVSEQSELENNDYDLKEIIKQISFDLDKEHLGSRVIQKQECLNIKEIDPDDIFQSSLADELGVSSFACIPLVVNGEAIGVLCVDNIVNQQEITYEDIDSLLPFANQAALAINNARLHELKEEMAIKDNLTGLYNQRYFQNSLTRKVNELDGSSKLGLLMIDIDYFKVYNDNNGHPAGNQALIKVAQVLENSVRSNDIVCRYGGEEFAIILPDVSCQELEQIAERIRQNIVETKFKYEVNQPSGQLTVSIGGALFPEDVDTKQQLIDAADKALYSAKESGRNLVKKYQDSKFS
ncbi:hypothetical protein JCM16358_24820 [Halanaerocella petrolearia]